MAASAFSQLMAQRDTYWLQNMADAHLSVSSEGRPPDGAFHASAIVSQAGQGCDRYLEYCLYVVPPSGSLSAKTSRIFRQGNDTHLSIQEMMHEMGVLVKLESQKDAHRSRVYETPFEVLDPPMRGSADGVILKPLGDQLFVLEIKTINTEEFKAITGPKIPHRMQLNIYMGALGIYKGIFIYEDKNTQDQKFWEVDFDNVSWDALLLRLKRIFKLYINDTLADRVDIPACKTCTWFQRCKGVGVDLMNNSVSKGA